MRACPFLSPCRLRSVPARPFHLGRRFFSGSRKRAFGLILIFCVAFESAACGTLIHRDRWGQSSGRLDPSIVILDGLGLLIFLVPGVVAFIVDFSTGAIYLPER